MSSYDHFVRLWGLDRPGLHEPAANLLDAAARDVPVVLIYQGQADPEGKVLGWRVIQLPYLVDGLLARGHCVAAASWAIIRLLERHFLEVALPVAEVKPLRENLPALQLPEEIRKDLSAPQLPEIISHPVVIANRKWIARLGPCTVFLDGANEASDETELAIEFPIWKALVWSTPYLWNWWGRTPQAVLTLPPVPEPNSPRVVLNGPGKPPVVLNNPKAPLTKARYDVVKALLDAGPEGLTKDGLVKKSGHTDAVNTLKALARSDSDWRKVIHLPGRPGRRYRVY